MFTGGLLTWMAIGGFPSFVEEMKVLLLQFFFDYFQIVPILNKDYEIKFDYEKTSKADATNRNLLTQLDHDMIFEIRVMHRRSLNLAHSVTHAPKLPKCTFRSTKLLIISCEV